MKCMDNIAEKKFCKTWSGLPAIFRYGLSACLCAHRQREWQRRYFAGCLPAVYEGMAKNGVGGAY